MTVEGSGPARKAALAAALAALLAPGLAAEARAGEPGWYAGVNVPLMFIDDTDSTVAGVNRSPAGAVAYAADATTGYKTGIKLGGVLGYALGNGARLEGELFFARAAVGELSYGNVSVPALGLALPGELSVPVSGSADQLGAMVNLWYDFDVGESWTPYVGGGVGFIRVDQGDVKYDSNAVAQAVSDALAAAQGVPAAFRPKLPEGYVPQLSASDSAFAYQAGAGIGYALSDRATIRVGYRLQATGDLEFSGENATATVDSTTSLMVHFLELGVRYRF